MAPRSLQVHAHTFSLYSCFAVQGSGLHPHLQDLEKMNFRGEPYLLLLDERPPHGTEVPARAGVFNILFLLTQESLATKNKLFLKLYLNYFRTKKGSFCH